MSTGNSLCLAIVLAILPGLACAGTLKFTVDDADGALGRTGAPHRLDATSNDLPDAGVIADSASGQAVPCQVDRHSFGWHLVQPGATAKEESSTRTLWWLMPPGPAGKRAFEFRPAANDGEKTTLHVAVSGDKSHVDILEGDKLVLRYHYGNAPLPEGVPDRYACGDYIHPLCGPDGEVLTDAHPKDHPHHRGVMWTWPVTKWNGQKANPWVCAGCWTRPEALSDPEVGAVFAQFRARQLWKWGDKEPVVRQEVTIRAYRQVNRCRTIDIGLRLTALVDGLTISGEPPEGYGGFGLRMAPHRDQQIQVFSETNEAKNASARSWTCAMHTEVNSPTPGRCPICYMTLVPTHVAKVSRSWGDYSDTFAGGTGRAGVTLLEHVTNPLYPNAWRKYPNLNFFMPTYPGPRDVPLPKDQAVELHHRLWIHAGDADAAMLADQCAAYAKPPAAVIQKD